MENSKKIIDLLWEPGEPIRSPKTRYNYWGARERDPRTLASELPRSSREPR
jgi:hypothetical protein